MISCMTQAPSHSYRSGDPSSNKPWPGGVMAVWAELAHLFAMICGWVFGCLRRDWHTPETDDVPSPEPRDHQELIPAAPDSLASQFQRARTNPCARIPGEGRGPVFWPEVQKATGAQSAPRNRASCGERSATFAPVESHAPPLNQAAGSPHFLRSPQRSLAEAPPYVRSALVLRQAQNAGCDKIAMSRDPSS